MRTRAKRSRIRESSSGSSFFDPASLGQVPLRGVARGESQPGEEVAREEALGKSESEAVEKHPLVLVGTDDAADPDMASWAVGQMQNDLALDGCEFFQHGPGTIPEAGRIWVMDPGMVSRGNVESSASSERADVTWLAPPGPS